MNWKKILSSPHPWYEYRNGNHIVKLYCDGTKVKETIDPNDDHFTYEFPESFDLKITDYCDAGCAYCHENSTTKGKHADLNKLLPMLDTIKPGVEIAIGGGDATSHPQINWFIHECRKRGLVPNITVNQKHLKKSFEFLNACMINNYIGGIGVSLTDSTKSEDFTRIARLGQHVVIHTIAGILKPEDYKRLFGKKVLILGYKNIRRGNDNLTKHSDEIQANIEQLRNDLPMLEKKCKLLSFDCLGMEQLHPKETLGMPDDKFNLIYQGHDYDMFDKDGNITVSTMFVDAVQMKVSRSSTSAMDKRYSFTGKEDVRELLAKSCEGY